MTKSSSNDLFTPELTLQYVFAVKGRQNLLQKPWRDEVFKYIENQEEHHRKKTFREEYLDFLKKFEIEYDEKYFFEWIE
jgi:hypothetical protein